MEQQNCSGEEVPHSEPGLSKAKDILPEAQENGVAQRVPEDRSACECDKQQTEEARSQLDTQGAVGVVGFKTRKCALKRETGNYSETESSSSPVEHHQMEATTAETKSCESTIESNCVSTEPRMSEIQRTDDVTRADSDHRGSQSTSAHSYKNVHMTELTQHNGNTPEVAEHGAEDGDEGSGQNGDENCENAINSNDSNAELLSQENDDGHDEDGGTGAEHSDVGGEGEEAEAGDEGEEAEADVADGQHSLSGPDRRRQIVRHQRRQEAGALPQRQSRRIFLPESLLAQWREIGAQWGLHDDNDIAHVLLRHYEDTVAGRPPRPPPRPRCQGCGEVLVPMPCDACGPNRHSYRLTNDRDHGSSGSGRNGFCGRCRD